MPNERPSLKELFLAVLEVPPSERADWLRQACGQDAELYRRLEQMLAAHDVPQSLLDRPGPASSLPQAAIARPAVPEPERPGTVIGPYKLLQQIAEGGMGTVFMAEQSQPVQRKVAVKIIKPGLDSRQVIARFEAERQALALMDHPNIAKVLDAGTTDAGRPYFVMELVKGVPITQYCNDHELSPKERLELFIPVCQAVQHAHQKGVIHRDLKPSNVLIALYDGQPVPKIIDFGVAKAMGPKLTEQTLFTEFGTIIGTLEYMSPEQAELNQLDVDTRSDVYSLGVLLYELLTGTTPLDRQRIKGTSILEVLRIIREEELPRPSTWLSQTRRAPAGAGQEKPAAPLALPPRFEELDWIVMKCLEKDRSRRYETANALARDVERYLHDEPVQACPPSAVYRLRKFARRNKAAFLATLAVAVSLLLAVAVLAVSIVRIATERDEKATALAQAQRAERDAQEQLCDSLFVQAHAGHSSRRPGQRLDSLKALKQAAQLSRALGRGPADLRKLRNEAVACLALPDVRLEKEWEGHPAGTNGLGFDASFERYAWSFKDEGLRIRRVADHQEWLHLPTLPAERVSRWLIPCFSPDGRYLAVWYALWTAKHPLQVWELKPGVSRPLITLEDAATQPEFSPDGRTLAVGLSDKSVCLFDLATGQETRRLTLDLVPVRLAFHPDGQKLAVSSNEEHQVQVRDLQSGQVLYALSHPAGVQAVAWDPEGRLLATGCDDRRIYLWDGLKGARRGVFEGHSWEVHDLAFSQNGDWLASFGWDMTLRLWDVATGKTLWHLEDVRVVSFRRGEPLQVAASSGRQVRLWACVPSSEFRVLHGPTNNVRAMASSPDGRYLAWSTFSGESYLWDGQRVEGLPDALNLNWDPEGNLWVITKTGQLLRRTVQSLRRGGRDQFDPAQGQVLLPEPLEPGAVQWGSWFDLDQKLLLIVSPAPPAPICRVKMFAMDGTPRRLWARKVPNLGFGGRDKEGRWLALGTQDGGRGITILEARSGKLVHELEIGDACPDFSPDGRWLVTTTGRLTTPEGECCLWRTDTWQQVRCQPLRRSSSSPAPVVVSPVGALVAVPYTMFELQLLHLETLEEIVTLTAPEPGLIAPILFSPDGRRLFLGVGNTVHVWDLHALRRGLRDVELDWETPGPSVGGN